MASRNYWICSTRENGAPHSAPVWGLWLDDRLVFSTSPDSVKGRNLERDPRVSVNLESGDDVVILEGKVARAPIDAAVADAYEAKYEWRPNPDDPSGMWLELRPRVAYAWTEQDFLSTATRFDWRG